jgi:hypothetical protein
MTALQLLVLWPLGLLLVLLDPLLRRLNGDRDSDG